MSSLPVKFNDAWAFFVCTFNIPADIGLSDKPSASIFKQNFVSKEEITVDISRFITITANM